MAKVTAIEGLSGQLIHFHHSNTIIYDTPKYSNFLVGRTFIAANSRICIIR